MKEKTKIKKNLVIKVITIIFITVIIATIFYLLYNVYLSIKNKSIYEEIEKEITIDENKELDNNLSYNVKKVKSLKNKNEDVMGWIEIENTNINYPLLQTSNNDYYLTHTYKKQKSKYGSIFIKNGCDIENNNSNIIIYGHNMRDKQMFNQLLNYENEEFYNNHKTIKIATEQEENEYSIITVFKSKIFYQDDKEAFKYYNYINFNNEAEFNYFIENCKKQQLYNTSILAQYGEQLITLITCDYSQENGRIIIVAKKN